MQKFTGLIFILAIFLAFNGCGKPAAQVDNPADEVESTVQAEDVTPHDPTEGLENGRADIGREYFLDSTRGKCLDCHTLNGEGNTRGFEGEVWALDDAGLRRDPEWLAVFIDNPRTLRPEVARMPPFRGDVKGATIADIVAFLMTLKTEVDHPETADIKPVDEPDPNLGGIGGFTGHGNGY